MFNFNEFYPRMSSEDGGQRTAGDVLNDIGSMLADLTDELDAMLHMDPRSQGAQGGAQT